MLFNRNINFLTSRETVYLTANVSSVQYQPSRNCFGSQSFVHAFEVFFSTAVFHNGYNIANSYQCGRNVQTFAVNSNVAMSYDLASLTAGVSQAEAENYVVDSSFEEDQQVFTGDTFHLFSFIIVATELFFQYAIDKFSFLFFS